LVMLFGKVRIDLQTKFRGYRGERLVRTLTGTLVRCACSGSGAPLLSSGFAA
jgi:hypothetical protein